MTPEYVFDRYWEMRQSDRPTLPTANVLELSQEIRRSGMPNRDRDILFDEVPELHDTVLPAGVEPEESETMSFGGQELLAYYVEKVEDYAQAGTERAALELERARDLIVAYIVQRIHRVESHPEAEELLRSIGLQPEDVAAQLRASARRVEQSSGVVAPRLLEERMQLLESLCVRTELSRNRREELLHLTQTLFHLNASLASSELNCSSSGYAHLDDARVALLQRIETALSSECRMFWKAQPMMHIAMYKVITAHPFYRFEINHNDLD